MKNKLLNHSRIAKKLVVGIVLISSLLAIITTSIQLYFDYRQSVNSIHENLNQIELSALPSIVNDVWVLDDRQIQTQLDSLVRLQDISYVDIKVSDEIRWQAGQPQDIYMIKRSYPLEYRHKSQVHSIGTLEVHADLQTLYTRLMDKVLLILTSNALKTFLVAGFSILLFYYLVTRHLYHILDSVQNFRVTKANSPIKLSRSNGQNNKPDELDLLVLAFNQLQLEVTKSYQKVFKEKEKSQVTLNSIGDGVIVTDKSGLIESLNPVAEHLTGWTNAEAIGEPINNVFKIINEITRETVFSPVELAVTRGKTQSFDKIILINRQGNETAIEDSAAPIIDTEGNIIGTVLVFHDVTNARQLTQELSWNASHDPLTRLANRREFENQVSQVIEACIHHHATHILLFLDLDQFKIINDTCGHAAGDELLKQLSSLLETEVRKSDTLARLGGDEFGVLLRECNLEKGKEIAEHLRKIVEDFRFERNNKVFRVGVSIGLVQIKQNSTVEELIRHADIACYQAKAAGKNRIHIYQDKEGQEKEGELLQFNRIVNALENNQFELFAQPIVFAKSMQVHHYEILIRLRSEHGELILPNEFIPSAERYGIMSNIDRWVIRHSFEWLATQEAGEIKIAINLSGASLGDTQLPQFIAQLFDETKVNRQQISFEITETTAIANITQALKLINDLKKLGCIFALDDFGSGLSSFSYLKIFPVSYLKIDGVFVRDIIKNPIDYAMVQAIHQIGQVMQIETIAEYVENDELIAACQKMGINFLQGYGVGRPVPISTLVIADSKVGINKK